jgi:hypothetical protein
VEVFEPASTRGGPTAVFLLMRAYLVSLETCSQSRSLAMFVSAGRHAAVYLPPRLLHLLGPAVLLQHWALMYSENLFRLIKWGISPPHGFKNNKETANAHSCPDWNCKTYLYSPNPDGRRYWLQAGTCAPHCGSNVACNFLRLLTFELIMFMIIFGE